MPRGYNALVLIPRMEGGRDAERRKRIAGSDHVTLAGLLVEHHDKLAHTEASDKLLHDNGALTGVDIRMIVHSGNTHGIVPIGFDDTTNSHL